jgi:hypothetical protein
MVVMVRLNAQTPLLEQALISHQIPYRSASPFYERSEIETLLQYGRLAWVERRLLAGRKSGCGGQPHLAPVRGAPGIQAVFARGQRLPVWAKPLGG